MLVKAHEVIEHLESLREYPDHQNRFESAEFRHVKDRFHKEHAKCWIDNGYCEGPIEIHHDIIEWADANGVDWEKVKRDYPNVSDVDDYDQMMPLCRKHHRGKYTGIHMTDKPTWEWQKYALPDELAKFEAKVKELLNK
jgi:hypothetical protein